MAGTDSPQTETVAERRDTLLQIRAELIIPAQSRYLLDKERKNCHRAPWCKVLMLMVLEDGGGYVCVLAHSWAMSLHVGCR